MEIVDRQGNLSKPVQYLRLTKVFSFFLHVLDLGVHITEFTIDHDNAEVALVVSEWVLVGYDVDVPEFLEYFEFVLDVFSFFLIDLKGLDFLKGIVVILVVPVLAEEDVSGWSEYIGKYPVPISLPISYSYIFFAL